MSTHRQGPGLNGGWDECGTAALEESIGEYAPDEVGLLFVDMTGPLPRLLHRLHRFQAPAARAPSQQAVPVLDHAPGDEGILRFHFKGKLARAC